MQYNGNEIYATRYMKSLFLFGRRGDRIFSIVPDRCQILLYEKHGLCFVTTVFEIRPAYVYCDGEINFIDVFGIFRCFYHSVRSH